MGGSEDHCRAHLLIVGHVQGVGFRYATMGQAEARGVRGSVQNLPDGRVEVIAEGARSDLESLVAWCREGPRLARVFDVQVTWAAAQGEPPGFRAA